jgi:putative ABC transport system substrate-binding protein
MRRRDVFTLIGGATVFRPLAAHAQQEATPVIGVLGASTSDLPQMLANLGAFREGLGETGYFVDHNLAIEYRWAEGHYDQLPALAADLVGRKVDLIVTAGGTAPALAAKNATAIIPIVFVAGDPVTAGLVVSLGMPGGNLTGFSLIALELMPKRFELLSELLPESAAIALLINPNNPRTEHAIKKVRDAAREVGRELHVLKTGTDTEIDAAFGAIGQLQALGVIVSGPDPYFSIRRNQIVTLAARYGVPAIYAQRDFPDLGGLMSYGPSIPAVYRQAGVYAGRILHGKKPADLPVQQPTKFELVINLKTAKSLGLTVPQTLLARADEVIE